MSALVIVHEVGHFSVAKFFGIRVDEFGLGYPPRAKKLFRWKGTDFTLNWLPFGGFVKIFGESPNEENVNSKESFQNKNRGIQALVLFAGVFFNFLFAVFLLVIVRASVVEGLVTALSWTGETTKALLYLLSQALIGRADLSAVTGPVGLVSLVGQVSGLGVDSLLTFTALISINLCLINLLPFPALDGGRLLFVGIEALTRKRIPARLFNALNTAGFALLIFLMILVTIQDVRNIF